MDKFPSPRHNKHVEIRWIPGHTEIPCNKEADNLDKSTLGVLNNRSLTSATPSGENRDLDFAELGMWVIQRGQELVEEWWQKYRPKRYKDLDLFMRCKRP